LVRPTTQILDRNGRLLYEIVDPNSGKQLNVDLNEVPQACIQATLATEDSRFYYHPGVDPLAIARALVQNYRAGGQVVSGGSTLTQQLARNLLLEPEERYVQSVRRKLREAWIALRLEQRYTKDELLALYLNQTYYGHFAFGLEAAAEIFFAKPAQQLSRGECALLAGLVQYPSGYNPLQDEEIAKARQLTVLRLMSESGFITATEAQAIADEPLRYRTRLFSIDAPHFVMYVQDQIIQRIGVGGLRTGGYRIYTTLDLDLQRQAERQIRHRLDLLNCRRPGLCDGLTNPKRRVDNAAAVVLDAKTGQILAMVGSPDYFDVGIQGNVNAALSLRQPGSAIKPLTYAAALDPAWATRTGYTPLTPASILADLPTTFYVRDEQGANVPYAPVNYDRLFHGPVSVRAALANSYNIPAVKVLDHIGVQTLKEIASAAGITSFGGDFGLALTLGGGEVRLLDLATAFGIFQTGHRLENRSLLDVQEYDPATGWQTVAAFRRLTQPGATTNPQQQPIISPQTAYLITHMLSDSLARAPAFGEQSVLDLPYPTAVKTGTTTDWRDNWTIGYSTERIVGVWTGNADNAPMLDVSGIDGAGPIWRDLMLAAHPQPPRAFTRPPGLNNVTICAPSGMLPSPHCARQMQELFIAGTEPQQIDNQFQPVTIDRATNLPADATTPAERRVERVYWHLPPTYHDWMAEQNIPILPPGARATAQQSARMEEADAAIDGGPLLLAAPASNIAYQIHPGAPRARQRILIDGYTAQGETWHELRLVQSPQPPADAETASASTVILHTQSDTNRTQHWWQLEPGTHTIWIEGERTAGESTVRSTPALIVVEDYILPVAIGEPQTIVDSNLYQPELRQPDLLNSE
ncbi:MAG: transglycosylase domain-containing protein, partial [Litorilinea sp.]